MPCRGQVAESPRQCLSRRKCPGFSLQGRCGRDVLVSPQLLCLIEVISENEKRSRNPSRGRGGTSNGSGSLSGGHGPGPADGPRSDQDWRKEAGTAGTGTDTRKRPQELSPGFCGLQPAWRD